MLSETRYVTGVENIYLRSFAGHTAEQNVRTVLTPERGPWAGQILQLIVQMGRQEKLRHYVEQYNVRSLT